MTNELAELKAALEEQTKEISRRATEYERLRLAEEANRREIMRSNEINQRRIEMIDTVLMELRTAIHLLTYVIEPRLQRQKEELRIILEFIKLAVRKMNSHSFDKIQQQIISIDNSNVDMRHQEIIKSLAILRGNLAELKKQEIQFGIRVPLDLANEIRQTEKEIKELEQQLVELIEQ